MYPATEINTIANPFNSVPDEYVPASLVPVLEPTIPPMMKNMDIAMLICPVAI